MSDLSPKTTFEEILENAIEIEKSAGRLYVKFAKMFSSFPKAAEFWKEMNKDELDHAKWLIEIKESLSDKELSKPILLLFVWNSCLDEILPREIQRISGP